MSRSAFALVIVSLSLFGCGGENNLPPATPAGATPAGDHHAEPKAGSAVVKPNGDAKVGDTTKCPVSGEEFVVEATSPHVEYEGKTYYLCCSGCLKKVQAEPAKYLKKS